MDYHVQLGVSDGPWTAVVRRRARAADLSVVVPQGIGAVWKVIRSLGSPRPGRNVAVYYDGEINLECGVEVDSPFAGDGEVIGSRLPAGPVAWTEHIGPYHLLYEANAAILRWCAERGYEKAGPSWEVYGHWVDDATPPRTDVYYLIRDAHAPA
jgi:effector-binding domain-containing protein